MEINDTTRYETERTNGECGRGRFDNFESDEQHCRVYLRKVRYHCYRWTSHFVHLAPILGPSFHLRKRVISETRRLPFVKCAVNARVEVARHLAVLPCQLLLTSGDRHSKVQPIILGVTRSTERPYSCSSFPLVVIFLSLLLSLSVSSFPLAFLIE